MSVVHSPCSDHRRSEKVNSDVIYASVLRKIVNSDQSKHMQNLAYCIKKKLILTKQIVHVNAYVTSNML